MITKPANRPSLTGIRGSEQAVATCSDKQLDRGFKETQNHMTVFMEQKHRKYQQSSS